MGITFFLSIKERFGELSLFISLRPLKKILKVLNYILTEATKHPICRATVARRYPYMLYFIMTLKAIKVLTNDWVLSNKTHFYVTSIKRKVEFLKLRFVKNVLGSKLDPKLIRVTYDSRLGISPSSKNYTNIIWKM